MKQVAQKLADGRIEVVDAPIPSMGPNDVLIRNAYSLISSGTERATITTARDNLLQKARKRPEDVKRVVQTIKEEGITYALSAVETRLQNYTPLGYSCAGVVESVGMNVTRFKCGDYVAAAGLGWAVHAEYVAVPQQMTVAVPDATYLNEAAFNALGAIALQALRNSDCNLGSRVAIIGYGLIGQILLRLLTANGIYCAVVESSPAKLALAERDGAICAIPSDLSDHEFENIKATETDGAGFDIVYIAASTQSDQPINRAGNLARQRGEVVIIGDVGTRFNRDPDFYLKELSIKVSCSYGPGRYDYEYEQKGKDYPLSFVRWTESRNMEALQRLIADRKINLEPLISKVFPIDAAPEAYELLMDGQFDSGVLISYPENDKPERELKRNLSEGPFDPAYYHPHKQGNDACVVGPGVFCQTTLLPLLKKSGFKITSVVSGSSLGGKHIQRKYKSELLSCDIGEAFALKPTSTFITTQHHLHFPQVVAAIDAGIRNIYVEKPLCVLEDQLEKLIEKARKSCRIFIGFNRPYSRHISKIMRFLDSKVDHFICRINAGTLPVDSWILDKERGGGRLIGEVCHFIDLSQFCVGGKVTSVQASSIGDEEQQPGYNIALSFDNGRRADIHYVVSGNKRLSKEYYEFHGSGKSARLEDFSRSTMFSDSGIKKYNTFVKDKGHASMIDTVYGHFIEDVPFDRMQAQFDAMAVTFAAARSLLIGAPVTPNYQDI